MRMLADLIAAGALLLAAPWWIVRMIRRGTWRTDWPGRLGFGPAVPRGPGPRRPRVLVHAVSVGEVAAATPMLEELARPHAPGGPVEVVLSSTTDTGVARARQVAGDRHPVIRTPIALHAFARRWLRRADPDVLVLVELEVWPTMVDEARRRGVPVVVVNGRLTDRSLRQYRRVRRLVAPAFGRLAACGVQDRPTAARFAEVGVPADRIEVTGTMKWDRATIVDEVPGSEELAAALGIDRRRPLVVAGSTAPDETRLIDEAVGDRAQLLVAPRRPEWGEQVARDLPGSIRRSRGACGSDTGRFVLDTIGELRPAYALADVVIVGRTFGRLHGSDMMEPVGLGKPVVVGPRTDDFAAVTEDLLAGGGLLQVEAGALRETIERLLADPDARRALADRGRAVIRAHQGAAARHAAMVRRVLPSRAEHRDGPAPGAVRPGRGDEAEAMTAGADRPTDAAAPRT